MSSARKPVARKAKPGGRSMTFTGCWTCKRRKVKCDERPLRCTNCERMAIPCDGYGVKLQWMADPFSVAELHAGQRESQSQSRGRIRIAPGGGTVYPMAAIDAFLSTLERDVGRARGRPSQRGPFTVFPGRDTGCAVSSASTPKASRPRSPRAMSPAAEPPVQSSSPAFSDGEACDTGMEFVAADPVACRFASPAMPLSQPTPLGTPIEELAETLLASSTSFLEDLLAASPQPDPTLDRDDMDDGDVEDVEDVDDVVRDPTPLFDLGYATDSAMMVPKSAFAQVSGDTTINRLMHHYVVHVAGLLQPIDHPQNPYRTLYVPAALTAASGPLSQALTIADPNAAIQSVLLHSLMSSASFHLWNCNPARAEYHKIGAQQRRESLRLLNAALARHASAIDYQTLMMAMLSLVSIDIMSGCEADFVIHLRGTKQLQQRRKSFRIMSRTTRQLNQISDFLFLLARTTWFPASLAELAASPYDVDETCGDDDDDAPEKTLDRMADSCYPYMYGISPTLASYMDETCRLAEDLARHTLQHGSAEPPPEPLLEACERLGDRILAWTHALEDDDDGRILSSTGDPLARAIFRPHAQAWHRAIVIYYFRRIHGTRAPDHAQHVRTIAECMHAVEDIKARALSSPTSTLPMRRRAAVRMAPITWPAFIASCEGLHRGAWTRWWQRVQCYQIANIQRQWEMVATLWAHKDRMARAGEAASYDWTKVFRGYELTLIPI